MLPCATLLLTCPIPTQIKRPSILFNNYHCIRNSSMPFPLLTVVLPFFASWDCLGIIQIRRLQPSYTCKSFERQKLKNSNRQSCQPLFVKKNYKILCLSVIINTIPIREYPVVVAIFTSIETRPFYWYFSKFHAHRVDTPYYLDLASVSVGFGQKFAYFNLKLIV